MLFNWNFLWYCPIHTVYTALVQTPARAKIVPLDDVLAALALSIARES